MITHEQARRLCVWEYNVGKILDYITQQEKKEELLGLYREYYGHIPYSENSRIKECELKIDTMEDKFEEEMK